MKVNTNSIIAIIQARQTSQRFPNKILAKINGKFLFEVVIKKIKKSKYLKKIVLAVPSNKNNIFLRKLLKRKKINFFSGSENDVLDRYYKTAKKFKAKIVVRITGDCPLIDHEIIDQGIEIYLSNDYDVVTNVVKPSYSQGIDVQIFKFELLSLSTNNL